MKWRAIARLTFLELFRSKVLYGIFGFAILALLLATAFGAASIGSLAKVVKDFGLFLVTLSTTALATMSGSSLLNKELSKKTIYTVLSKPMSRFEYIIGKFAGLYIICLLIVFSLITLLVPYAYFFEGRADWNLVIAAFYICLEMMVLCGVSLFFSSIVFTPALSGILAFSFFLIGRGLLEVYGLTQNDALSPLLQNFFAGLFWILPQTFRFAVSNELVYGIVPSLLHGIQCFGYAAAYTTLLLTAGGYFFSRKDFN